ncbi:hypothetical protein GGI22_005014, partial [Coemansia erecta]
MSSQKTSLSFSQERNSCGVASPGNSNESKQNSEPPLALPTISPCLTEKNSKAESKRFASASLDISIAKSHIAHLMLPSPTESIASAPLFSTGLVSPTFTVSPAIPLAVSPVFSQGETGVSSFAPYRMAVTEPRVPELQRISYMSIAKHQQTQSIEAGCSTKQRKHIYAYKAHNLNDCASINEHPPQKRLSITSSVRKHSEKQQRRYIFATKPNVGFRISILATALSSSCFSVMLSNSMVSPLVRGSMVHIKVVMDADTIVIVPMMRSEVFARARERILTKLFRGGVPLVESKRRKLVARGENGSSLVIANNHIWRKVMDTTRNVHRLKEHSLVQSRIVAKLTLHLLDPQDVSVVSVISESHQSQAELPN